MQASSHLTLCRYHENLNGMCLSPLGFYEFRPLIPSFRSSANSAAFDRSSGQQLEFNKTSPNQQRLPLKLGLSRIGSNRLPPSEQLAVPSNLVSGRYNASAEQLTQVRWWQQMERKSTPFYRSVISLLRITWI